MAYASRIEAFDVVVPAGTAKTPPYVVDTHFPPGTVNHIEITVPAGHNGRTGIQLLIAGGQVIPLTPGSYLVANGQTLEWDLVGQLDSGAWQARAYNLDRYDHSFHIRYSVLDSHLTGAPSPSGPPPITPQLV